MKNSLRASVAVLLGASLSVFAMTVASNDGSSAGFSPSPESQTDGRYDKGKMTCCPCGNGKVCCVTIGPIAPDVPSP